MKRAFHSVLVVMLATTSFVLGQAKDVAKVLAEVRTALGGESRLDQVKSLTVEGTAVRAAEDGSSRTSPFQIAMELPDKYVMKEEMMNINGMSISRLAGFNGADLIETVDNPPSMGHGVMMFRSPSAGAPGMDRTPEQIAAARHMSLMNSRKDFARLSLGIFTRSFTVYPLEFTYAGQAESPDGKADVIDVKGDGDFAAKLFVDRTTHLPLMLSWMDKEPLSVQIGGPGARMSGGGQAVRMTAPAGGSPADMEKMQAEMAARMKEAEARRRVVEYRLFYSDYKAVDGIRLPMRVQRMIDGNPTQELQFEKVKVNGKVDQKLFEVSKDQ